MKYFNQLLLAVALLIPMSAQAVVLTFDDATTASLNPYQSDGFTLQAFDDTFFIAEVAPTETSFIANLNRSASFNSGEDYLSLPLITSFTGTSARLTNDTEMLFDVNSIDLGAGRDTTDVELYGFDAFGDQIAFLAVSGVTNLTNIILSGFDQLSSFGIKEVSVETLIPGVDGPILVLNYNGVSLDNIDISTTVSPIPVPAAAWLFGSALFGLFGFSRKKK